MLIGFKPRLSDLDLVAVDSGRLVVARIVAALALAVMIAPALGPVVAASWGAASALAEGFVWWATRPFVAGRPVGRRNRLAYLGGAICANTLWLALSLAFWFDATPGAAFVTLLIWCALLLNAVSYAFRSATALLVFAAPTIATMLAVPVAAARWSGPQQTLTVAGLLLCCAFALLSARRSVLIGRALARSQAELEAERQRAESANSAKSAFLAFMSHEIRTPLNGVLGMVQAMERDELTPAQRERLAVVASSGETLLFLLNDLLDLSRIEAGRLDLESGAVDVAAAAEAACEGFGALAADKGIDLRVEIEAGARGFWTGDATRIRQILVNLVANAVKFTDQGQVVVTVAPAPTGLVVTVSDTGPGIAPDRVAGLFDRFVQADVAISRLFGGSGLGLAICRQLAELMGGSIEVESVVGKGSRFVVSLPLVRATAPAPAGNAQETGAGPPVAGDLQVLVAEDNAVNRLVLSTLLGQVGLSVHMVDNGLQAVEAYAAGQWDLVLMDVQMPVMDGPTAVGLIRAEELAAGRPRTPIIALTANAMAHHRAEYLAAGMDALVPKPIQLDVLLAAMDEVLDAAEARKVA